MSGQQGARYGKQKSRRTRDRSFDVREWERSDLREPRRWNVTVKAVGARNDASGRTGRMALPVGELVTRDACGFRCSCSDSKPCEHVQAVVFSELES